MTKLAPEAHRATPLHATPVGMSSDNSCMAVCSVLYCTFGHKLKLVDMKIPFQLIMAFRKKSFPRNVAISGE